MRVLVLLMLLISIASCQMLPLFMVGVDTSFGESMAEMDVRRRNGDFKRITRQKIRQEDLPLDTRLYIAPDSSIQGDRDYSDGKGY